METWAILVLVIGLNIITVLSSYFLTKMQVSHSDRRFEKELARQREIETRKRKQDVKDTPLLKLRDELARMATKNNKLVTYASMLHTNIGTGATEEQVKEWLGSALNDWNNYIDGGVFEQVLLAIDDKDITDRVKQLKLDYHRAYIKNIRWEHLSVEELPKALEMPEKLKDGVREVQSLINKRLEEL